jgi:hypothetical protein
MMDRMGVRSLRLALAATAAGLAAAGCSASSTDPLAGLSGKQVLTKSVDDLKASPSFTISGTVTSSGSPISINLGFRPGQGCEGTVSAAGKGSLTMVVIGTTAYVKPDNTYWKAVAGAQASQAIATFGGKYLKGQTTDSTIAGLTQYCDLNSITSQLTQPSNVVKGTVTTVNGKEALPLKDTAKGGTLYVAHASSPLPIELVNDTGTAKGTLTFDVGAPVSLTAPPASQTVDATKYGL